jgi:hypothetical protein
VKRDDGDGKGVSCDVIENLKEQWDCRVWKYDEMGSLRCKEVAYLWYLYNGDVLGW